MKTGDMFLKKPCNCHGGKKRLTQRELSDNYKSLEDLEKHTFKDEFGRYMICAKCQGTGEAIIEHSLPIDITCIDKGTQEVKVSSFIDIKGNIIDTIQEAANND